ncbi:hypothetical protein [Fimbriimonas ginsengisoli]|uniref:Uncharacterized protein n=1 Tax=Fimbriimonas ginsengisoli Gsoil 348 TaxID=661478 RepID=A0A068NX50_FIMGI|nr:hypothetical protein [Fimbriimonas ginsengisoli]AIE87937.1 hypothetical protein OP10G_4569 [Fimbriimonas ginsengisoli Gsoil 348]
MKLNVPTPAIVAIVVVVVLVIGALFMKGAGGEAAAPKPDASRFLPKGVSPMKTP